MQDSKMEGMVTSMFSFTGNTFSQYTCFMYNKGFEAISPNVKTQTELLTLKERDYIHAY